MGEGSGAQLSKYPSLTYIYIYIYNRGILLRVPIGLRHFHYNGAIVNPFESNSKVSRMFETTRCEIIAPLLHVWSTVDMQRQRVFRL